MNLNTVPRVYWLCDPFCMSGSLTAKRVCLLHGHYDSSILHPSAHWLRKLPDQICVLSLTDPYTGAYTVLFFLNNFIYFIYFWLRWVFVAARGLSLVAASGDYSSLWCVGLSSRWLLLLQSIGFRHAGFSSCSIRAQ